MTKDEQNNLLDTVAGVFLRCFVMAFCLLLFWFFFYLAASDWIYSIHSRWFGIDRHNFDVMSYYGMGIIKMVSFLFFLFPYVSIKLILRKKQ